MSPYEKGGAATSATGPARVPKRKAARCAHTAAARRSASVAAAAGCSPLTSTDAPVRGSSAQQ